MAGLSVVNVILPLLCLLASPHIMMVKARQCRASSDCPAHSPHCSDWGWCQWTDQYGDQGPRARLETAEAGACSTDKDCSPRFPVCSNLGYCTVKDYFEKSGVTRDNKDSASDRVDLVRSLGPRETQRDSSHTNTIIRNNQNNRQKQEQLPAARRSDTSDGKSPDYYENYDYNYYAGFEVLRSDAKPRAPAKSIQHKIHGQFVGSSDRRPKGNRHVSRGRHVSRNKQRPPVTREPETPEYSDYYYPESGEEDSRDASSSSSASTGGCLNDCVSDCVAITQLTAYRDCVGFCGKTCKD